MHNNQTRHAWPPLPVTIFSLWVFFIILAGYVLFEYIKAHEKEDTKTTLIRVAQLKANQIQSYLAERKKNAAVVSVFLSASPAQHWLASQSGKGNAPSALSQLVETMVDTYQYKGLLVLDADANIRLGIGGTQTDAGKAIALRTMRARTPVFFKIHFGDPSAPDVPVLDIFMPIMSPDKASAVGMVVLRSPLDFLFSLIQTWPIESDTTESLLVMKDGSDVLFLNELRYQKDTALKLRVPLTADPNSPAWPAISAVAGHFGFFESNDYRGERVLAYTLAVPSTPWIIVVKMDIEEAVKHSQNMQKIVAIIVTIFIGCMGFVAWYWWREYKVERRTSKQLQESQSDLLRSDVTLKEAQNMAHLGSWELNLVTGSLAWTEECCNIFEFDAERRNIDFETFTSTIHPDDIGFVKHAYVTSLMKRSAYDLEFRLLFADDRVKWVHEHCTTIFDANGKPIRSMGTTQDISERKLTEKELRKSNDELAAINRQLHDTQNLLLQSDKMASVGQLAAGVAHEINNPIGYVNSNLGTLKKYIEDLLELIRVYEEMENSGMDDTVLEQVNTLKHKVDLEFLKEDVMSLMNESREGILRVKKIVQDLKDFSRVDSSDEWQRTNLHQGLDSTLNVASNEIKYKAEVKKEYGDIPEVECLPSQLNQVFMNLLVNAAHAIEEHGTITLRTGRQDDEVWVEIEDTGKGIAPEHINKIFDPFFTTKPVGKGTGLGLSLSYGIVKKHHGRIEVKSELGKGTSFKVWLPVNQTHDELRTV